MWCFYSTDLSDGHLLPYFCSVIICVKCFLCCFDVEELEVAFCFLNNSFSLGLTISSLAGGGYHNQGCWKGVVQDNDIRQ